MNKGHIWRAKPTGNNLSKEWVTGTLFADNYIVEVEEYNLECKVTPIRLETAGLCSGLQDIQGNDIFQGDILENDKGLRFEVRYGQYAMYCPVDNCMERNVGFFTVANGYYEDMPLGPTEQYAKVVGNIHDNPELKVAEKFRCEAERT